MVKFSDKVHLADTSSLFYELTCTEVDGCDDIRYTTYGIRGLDPDGNVVIAYADVDSTKAFVENIVEKCNMLGAAPLHLEDILLDFLP